MPKFSLGLFDFFSFLIPGFIHIISIVFIGVEAHETSIMQIISSGISVNNINIELSKIPTSGMVLVVTFLTISAYIIGHALYSFHCINPCSILIDSLLKTRKVDLELAFCEALPFDQGHKCTSNCSAIKKRMKYLYDSTQCSDGSYDCFVRGIKKPPTHTNVLLSYVKKLIPYRSNLSLEADERGIIEKYIRLVDEGSSYAIRKFQSTVILLNNLSLAFVILSMVLIVFSSLHSMLFIALAILLASRASTYKEFVRTATIESLQAIRMRNKERDEAK